MVLKAVTAITCMVDMVHLWEAAGLVGTRSVSQAQSSIWHHLKINLGAWTFVPSPKHTQTHYICNYIWQIPPLWLHLRFSIFSWMGFSSFFQTWIEGIRIEGVTAVLIVTLTIHQMQSTGTPEPMRFHSNQCMCVHQLRHSLGPQKHKHDFYFCQLTEHNTVQKSGAKRKFGQFSKLKKCHVYDWSVSTVQKGIALSKSICMKKQTVIHNTYQAIHQAVQIKRFTPNGKSLHLSLKWSHLAKLQGRYTVCSYGMSHLLIKSCFRHQ